MSIYKIQLMQFIPPFTIQIFMVLCCPINCRVKFASRVSVSRDVAVIYCYLLSVFYLQLYSVCMAEFLIFHTLRLSLNTLAPRIQRCSSDHGNTEVSLRFGSIRLTTGQNQVLRARLSPFLVGSTECNLLQMCFLFDFHFTLFCDRPFGMATSE